MHTRWIEGSDHGLVWEHGLAIVQATVSLDAARTIWTGFARGGDLAGFLKLLSSVTGSDLLSLPSFAIALRGDSGEWQLAARGDMQVQVDADVVRGVGISTWAERFVAAGRSVAVGAAAGAAGGEGGVERPIVAGLVPACGLAWGDPEAAVAAPAAVDPRHLPFSQGVPESSAVAELIALPEPAALPEPEAPVALVGSDEVPQPAAEPEPEPAPVAEPEPEPEPEAPAEPNPLPEPDEPAPKSADQETLMQEQQSIPEEAVDLPRPTDVAASPDAAPAPPPGRFARQFGDTQLFSVEDAAVRGAGDVDFISGVPSSGAPVEPAPASVDKAIDEALADELLGEGDHDGFTMMLSTEAAARLASAPVVEAPAAAIVGPSVLGVECVRGHANPPHRSSCSTCGGELVGQPHRMPRPAVGRLLLPNGEHLDLTAPVIVGRNPRADRVQGGTMPTLVPLSQGHVSGSHLEIRLEEWNVLAVDLHSTNGTFLRRHGEAPVRLGERPELLIEGDVLDLGHGVQLTLEHLR